MKRNDDHEQADRDATAQALREGARRYLQYDDEQTEDDAAGAWMQIVHGGDTGESSDWDEEWAEAKQSRPERADRDADNVPSDEERVREYAEAIRYDAALDPSHGVIPERVLAVADAEMAEKDREIERLRADYDREAATFARFRDEWIISGEDLVRKLALTEDELEKVEAAVTRVRALADLWISREGWFDPSMDTQTHLIADRVYAQVGKHLRAALRGPEPTEEA